MERNASLPVAEGRANIGYCVEDALDEIDRLRQRIRDLEAVVEAAKEYARQALPAPHDLRLREALARMEHSEALEEDPALDFDRDEETRGAQLSQGGDR
jgi:hypothetical protein